MLYIYESQLCLLPVVLTVVSTRLSCQPWYKVITDQRQYPTHPSHTTNQSNLSISQSFLLNMYKIPCKLLTSAYSYVVLDKAFMALKIKVIIWLDDIANVCIWMGDVWNYCAQSYYLFLFHLRLLISDSPSTRAPTMSKPYLVFYHQIMFWKGI